MRKRSPVLASELDQLAQHVVGTRLSLLDAGDVLGTREHDVIGEARRRGLATIAMVGYDGGRIAAEELADHVVLTRSEHIPRIQEAQASAYHVLRELIELGGENR